MESSCSKCGGPMDKGFTTALGLTGGSGLEGSKARIVFVTPGTKTSKNPIQAFRQGLSDEPANRAYEIYGRRCRDCGYLELFAVDFYAQSQPVDDKGQ